MPPLRAHIECTQVSGLKETNRTRFVIGRKQGKEGTSQNPHLPFFFSKSEYEAALNGRFILCDKEDHEGERLLPPGDYYSNLVCKSFKRKQVYFKRKEKEDPSPLFESAEEWFSASVNPIRVSLRLTPSSSAVLAGLLVRHGYCKDPKRKEFTNDADFERACYLKEENNQLYRHSHQGGTLLPSVSALLPMRCGRCDGCGQKGS